MSARRRRLSWLQVPPDREIPLRVRALWREPRRRLGFIPNIFRVFALRPAHLARWWAYYDDLLRGPSGLSRLQREMIAVVVSSANRCHY
ncbi:MAG: carboxymuconolactone decarboxylase family protein [Armatimonadota bacterium]|nr:carboxymuconolactone decarboxylase family protein [Armatimonadota bacterium]MDR7401243.1 carboxymuconolactone decarboxylase family protein [Armatimonadota bacterium]MDR7402998.1 carboxymuconolactone decarboxylase family protein [Armatimonadota bacterium]MDR7437137.1 carboxymuconolactone decarboxylase family protein [Armatimonadota bacterium]MDR7471889.1 carboxymuconolactone decarboxylase family protein [Armatimonadota bacterium]